jgi:peptidoglycan/LPS O-acetylase OafA/YrhL
MKHLPSLYGLRAISILMVILAHYRLRYHLAIARPLGFFFDGQLGVNVFFVMSGFLITKLLLAEEVNTGKISLPGFYRRRVIRIFPAYYFLLIVYVILQLVDLIHLSKGSWITSVLFVKYLYMTDHETDHFWTLSVEENFYLLFPLCLVYWRRHIDRLLIGGILVVALIRLICYRYHLLLYGLDQNIFMRGDALLTGCLFALHEEKAKAIAATIAKKISAAFCVLMILLLLYGLSMLDSWNYKYGLHLNLILMPFGGTTGTAANFLIGFLLVFSMNNKNGWYFFLNFPVMEYIGKLSYSLYLWQQIFILSLYSVPALHAWPVSLLASFAAANFSYYLIEKPFMRWGLPVRRPAKIPPGSSLVR